MIGIFSAQDQTPSLKMKGSLLDIQLAKTTGRSLSSLLIRETKEFMFVRCGNLQRISELRYNFSFQVSTETGSVSHYYNLGIIVPRAYILGADEYYAQAGGDISLVCIIEDVRSHHTLS